MNVALIHDKYSIKNFWEQKIENHYLMTENEETRMKSSALAKLRGEWTNRLESRTKHLKKVNEENLRKARPVQTADQA
ncbi:protein FAM240C [Megalops cyprinoides]|uniref:protein FAM240C n=1 Tax=Megalops cyprinoides TaxID=118141 RepID=UPI001864165F|nr:protein FAM240C [Megalops cyprinoides]